MNFNVKSNCKELKNANHIFPIKQAPILKIVNTIKDYVDKIYIFGSSTRWDCNYGSDIDLVVYPKKHADMNKIGMLLAKQSIGSFDLFSIEDLHNANKTFLKKYERDKVLVYE